MRVLLLFILVTSSLFAERAGPYVGVAYGVGFYDSDNRLQDEHSKIEDGTIRFTLGAYINENFSVELDYTLYKKFYGTYDGADIEESFSTVGVTALPHYPFYNDTFDFYGKIGAGQLFWNETGTKSNSDSAGTYILGLGIGYRFDEELMIKLGYDINIFSLEDSNHHKEYSMNLNYIYTAFEYKF
jgi:opacity protein-like surface antigen